MRHTTDVCCQRIHPSPDLPQGLRKGVGANGTDLWQDNRADCWVYMEGGQARQDGRLVWHSADCTTITLVQMHKVLDNQAAPAAETKLSLTTYTGEKKRWNFDKYVRTGAHCTVLYPQQPGTAWLQGNRRAIQGLSSHGRHQDKHAGPCDDKDYVVSRITTGL